MRTLADMLPWFLPGLVVTTVIALAVADRVAQRLHTTKWIALLLIMSVGTVLAATVPPDGDGIHRGLSALGTCDFGRNGPAPFNEYVHLNETGLNVILFVPLGLAVGLLKRTRPRAVVAVLALPLTIEAVQALVPVLGRGCQSGDVVDNLVGLGIGFMIGLLVDVIRCHRHGTAL